MHRKSGDALIPQATPVIKTNEGFRAARKVRRTDSDRKVENGSSENQENETRTLIHCRILPALMTRSSEKKRPKIRNRKIGKAYPANRFLMMRSAMQKPGKLEM